MNRSIRTLATTPSRGSDQSSAMQLSIYCRKGRTELVVVGPAISGHVEDYAVSYRINGNDPVQIAGGLPSFGAGAGRATSCACCSRCPRRATSPSDFPPARVEPVRGIFRSTD